jgi:hypothetical protein
MFHSQQNKNKLNSYRYRNEWKIRPKKRIGFMHIDIPSQDILLIFFRKKWIYGRLGF